MRVDYSMRKGLKEVAVLGGPRRQVSVEGRALQKEREETEV